MEQKGFGGKGMKCPWRVKKHVQKDGMGHIYSDTSYGECYGTDCPFYEYVDAQNGEIVYEGCMRKERS